MPKLATWNLDRPEAAGRREAIRAHTDRERADVWVLTETHDGFTPGHPFSHSSEAGRDGHDEKEHHWVTIWSQHPLKPVKTSDGKRAAAARILPESGTPFVVYGTVLPWLGSPWREHPSAGGVAFREALLVQLADWVCIQREFPEDEFFVLGDFNQDLVHPHYYGSRANRRELESALEAAGLVALTSGDRDPIRRGSAPWACIDHICGSRNSKWRADPATRWPDLPEPERWMSDHFGLSVTFELA